MNSFYNNIKAGFEIELEADCKVFDKFNLERNEYHEHEIQYVNRIPIRLECDSSIVCDNEDNEGYELITQPYTIPNALKKLRKLLIDITGKSETEDISNILIFNDTTGSHVHLSATKTNLKGLILNQSFLTEFDKQMNKKLKEYPEVRYNFYRYYARKVNYFHEMFQDKYQWINYCRAYGTIEIRGVNLRGVKTIKDILKVYNIIFDCFFKSIAKNLKKTKELMQIEDIMIKPIISRFNHLVEVVTLESETNETIYINNEQQEYTGSD